MLGTRWAEKDSNLRRLCQLIYSQSPLAAWVSAHDMLYGANLSRRRESNPQPTVYKTVALPLSYVGLAFFIIPQLFLRSRGTKEVVYATLRRGQIPALWSGSFPHVCRWPGSGSVSQSPACRVVRTQGCANQGVCFAHQVWSESPRRKRAAIHRAQNLWYNHSIMNYTRSPIVRRMGQDWIFWLIVGAILVAFLLLQAGSGLGIVYTLFALLVAITVHEFSHAWAALRLGDSTASGYGRVSLNPLVHLDPLGTVMMFITTLTGLGIGWGKPVPVVPYRLRFGPRVGNALVAVAGPLSNVAVAVVVGLILRVGPDIVGPAAMLSVPWLTDLLSTVMLINLVIALFNLLPIPPLDGYSVLIGLLALTRSEWGRQAANTLESWNRFGMMLLFGLILFSQFLRLNILWNLVGQPAYSLAFFILGM